MIVLELNQIEVDHCTRCGGVWLDAEEMDLLLDGSAGRAEIREKLEIRLADTIEEVLAIALEPKGSGTAHE